MTWQQTQIGKVLTFQRGFDITKAAQKLGPYYVISSSGPNSKHNEYKVKGPGVVIGRKGSLGTVFFSKQNYWPHDTSLWVKDFHGNDPRFAYYFLQTMSLEKLDVGASNPTLNRNHIHVLPVLWPVDVAVQRRIAGILSAYDDLIENNNRRIAIIEEIAQRIYNEWFMHFRYPGHESTPFVQSDVERVPAGWKLGSLQDIVENIRHGIRPGEHLASRKYVPIECIGRKSLVLSDAKDYREAQSSLVLFEEKDILFGAMRPYFHKVAIAPFPGVTRTTCFVLRPKAKNLVGFSACTLFSEAVVAYASAHMQGATIPYAVWDGSLCNCKIAIPPDALLERFEEIVSPMLALIQTAMARRENLRITRDLLLPRLISGELDVSAFSMPEDRAT